MKTKFVLLIGMIFISVACGVSSGGGDPVQSQKSTGEKMVDFIVNILSDKPKLIEESLIRDDI